MDNKELFNLMRMVYKNVRCPQCGKRYFFSDIKVRAVLEDVCFLEMHCPEHMPLIATIILPKKVNGQKPSVAVKVNDVIETHKFLKKFEGGFAENFEKISKKIN